MFCEIIVIQLVLRTLTCIGSQLFYTMPVGVPRPGYEVAQGIYTVDAFYIGAKTTYKGKLVNVGKYVVCLSNGSCIHEYPTNPASVGQVVSSGCFRVKYMFPLFNDIMPDTQVYVVDKL